MKLLIALLFVLPLSVQAGHHKGKKKAYKKSFHHRFHNSVQHYLIVGTVLDFYSTTVGNKKETTYAVQLGKGFIFKKNYDVSFLLGYEKITQGKEYGVSVSAKYLLQDGVITKNANIVSIFKPYVGIEYGIDKQSIKNNQGVEGSVVVKQTGLSIGSRFAVTENMQMDLGYTYIMGGLTNKSTSGKEDIKASLITMKWNYFF